MGLKREIDISIIVLTYFHEAYISKALDSILMQETDLWYEVLVGDDASQDQTPQIVQSYADRHPEKIFPTLREKNVGANRNWFDLCSRARGKYVAVLEGDDFWLDPCKLQKQWDFLEEHPEYIGCCGKCLIVDRDNRPDYTQSPHFVWNKKEFHLEDLVERWDLPGQVGTWMYRNIYLGMRPGEFETMCRLHPNVGDKTVALLLLSRGPIYCSNEVLSCYRKVDQKGERNWFSIHHANPYRNYDMFMYPCRLETWARKDLNLGWRLGRRHLGKRGEYRFCRFVEELVREPSLKRLQYLADMVTHSHQPAKYGWTILKALIEME